MIKVTLDKKEFKIASEWADVNFGQYIDMLSIQENVKDELELCVKLIANLSDKPIELEEALYEIDMQDLNDLSVNFEWMSKSFEDIAKKSKRKNEFIIDGRKFVIKENFNKLTIGEQISVEVLLKEKKLHHQEIAIGILLREVIDGKEKKFDMDDFTEVISDLKYKINLIDIFNYVTFFLRGAKRPSKSNTKAFSVEKI